MSNGDIDRIPVNSLSDRYGGLARSAVYKRLEALGIQPEKVGNKAYLNADQIDLMDDLHDFIQMGGSTAEFLESRGLGRGGNGASGQRYPGQSSGLSNVQPDLVSLVSLIAGEIAARFQPQSPQRSPMDYYDVLERAAQNGWLLRTSEVATLLDLSPQEILQHYGERFSEAGFVFTRAGYRAGREVAWKVSKR